MLHDITDDEDEPLMIPATVDYRAAFGDVVYAGGYRYPDPDVTAERFWRNGEGSRTLFFRILRASTRIGHADVEAAIAAHGVRPATPLEMLTVCAAYPDLPLEGHLAALGVIWEQENVGTRRVPVVQRYNGKRYLDLHPLHFLWKPGDQFLVAPADGGAP